MTVPFEIFAIRYGTHGGRRATDNFVGADPHETASDLDYFVWVLRRPDEVYLVDTGFGPDAARRRGRTLLVRPSEALGLLGLEAGAIDRIILTHLHFDHAGTLADFPAARIHVQDSELSYCTGRCMCHAPLRVTYDVEDVVHLVRRVHEGRVHFHQGREQLADGLWLHHVGGHSAGLQVVRVWSKRGWVVLASDASHLYANMREGRLFPILSNAVEMMEGYRTIHALASSPDHVIPGHDPLVMSRYRPPHPSMQGIVVRLDEDPIP